jgi:hypothetical protein
MNHHHLTELMSGLCLATLGAFVLVALGAGLMTTACVLAEFWSRTGRAP